MSNFKWMPLACLNLSAANLAAAEKLRSFGFVVNCGEFGQEKYTKASLGIYDVLAAKENANILIVSDTATVYSWYRVLVTGIGADFKIVTGAADPLVYFNEHSAGLYIVSSETLFKENVLKTKLGRRFVWDLVIIDEEMNADVPDYKKYRDNFVWTADRLMINAPFPARTEDDRNELCELIKAVLDNSELSANAEKVTFGVSAARMNDGLPVMRYFDKSVYTGDAKRNVTFVDYGFSDETMQNLRRRVDLRSGLPTYLYGGNVFEGFDCEKYEREKKIYLKPFYGRSDVEDLRAFDKKLDAMLKVCGEIMDDPQSRMMIYVCDKNTMDYLSKALTCLYGADVHVAREELNKNDEIKRKLSVDGVVPLPRIVIGTDSLGTSGDDIENITHIINYELPMTPVLLERRMTRHGGDESKRKFMIFRDSNKLFDSCMLDKVLFLQLETAFCGELPARNILLDIPEKAESVNGLIADLKYTRDYAKQVDNCLDLIKKVKCEYTIPMTGKITNSKQLAEFASAMLARLYKLLGLSEKSTSDDISTAMGALDGLCVINDGKLETAPDRESMAKSFEDDSYTNLPFASEAVIGLAEAKSAIDELHNAEKSENFHLKIKQEISELEDGIQYPVLFGIWKYRAKESDVNRSDRSFKDYIKIYNDGI